jgi:Ca2+:H+ antiporter
MVTTLTHSFAFLLIAVYILGLFFTFKTHKHVFSFPSDTTNSNEIVSLNMENEGAKVKTSSDFKLWTKKKSIGILAINMIGITIISEILVGSVEETISNLDLGITFIGAIVIGIAGNVPEKVISMMMTRKGKLDLSIGIATSWVRSLKKL